MTGHPLRKACRITLALVLAAELSGCVSVSTTRTKATTPSATDGALEVAVYDTPAKAKAGVPTSGVVSLDLGRLEKGRPEAPVQASSGATWSLEGLPPGKYRLHLKATVPGSAAASAPKVEEEDIRIAAGEVVRAEMILKKFPVLAVVCVAVGVGAIAGVLAWYSNNWFKGGTLQLGHAKKPLVTFAPAARADRGPERSSPTRRRVG